jgi:hypothetical protein
MHIPAINAVTSQRRFVILLGTLGVFLCYALRELKIGTPQQWLRPDAETAIFPWAVFAVAIWRVLKSDHSVNATAKDLFAVLMVAIACILLVGEVSKAGIGLAIGVLGALALWRAQGDDELVAGGVCLLALCANLSIAPLVFRLGYSQFINVDMAMLQTAINISGAPVTATPAGLLAADGLRVMLVGGCSSFTGVSVAVLVHMGWAMAVRTEVGWRDMVAVAATVCVATLLNVARLTLTASGYEAYAFWHGAAGQTPVGGQIFWFAQNLVLLTGGYLSASWAAAPRSAQVLA